MFFEILLSTAIHPAINHPLSMEWTIWTALWAHCTLYHFLTKSMHVLIKSKRAWLYTYVLPDSKIADIYHISWCCNTEIKYTRCCHHVIQLSVWPFTTHIPQQRPTSTRHYNIIFAQLPIKYHSEIQQTDQYKPVINKETYSLKGIIIINRVVRWHVWLCSI